MTIETAPAASQAPTKTPQGASTGKAKGLSLIHI